MQQLGQAYTKRAEATTAKAAAKATTKAKGKPKGKATAAKAKAKATTKAKSAPKQVPTYNIEWCRNRVVCRFGPEGAAPAFSFKHGDASSTNKAKAAGRKWVLATCKQLKCDPPTKVLA